jgi:hypothetical protein
MPHDRDVTADGPTSGRTVAVILASAAFQAGQVVGVLILVFVVVGVVRTFSRKDLTWREKLLGKKDDG